MSALQLFSIGLLLCSTLALTGQTPNRPVPPDVPAYEFVLHDSSYQGYYLTTPFLLGNTVGTEPKPLLVLDSRGYIIWYALVDAWNTLDFKFNPEYQRYQFIKYSNPQTVQYVLMDTGFNLIDSFTTVNGIRPDVHDFQLSKTGTALLAGVHDSILDLSAYQFSGSQGSGSTRVLGFVVQELDADRKVVFQWNSNEHIHPGDSYVGYPYHPASFDYCHGNTIEEEPDGNLLLSFRNLNAVYKIDRQTGAILWQLGGKFSDFSFANDGGFSGQHDVRRLPNGNIAMFDNANMAAPPQHSRAVEYQLDTVQWVATKIWEYQYSPAFFSSAMGGHQTTADRRHLINYGLNYRPDPSFVLVDDGGARLSELFFQDSVMSYRAALADLPLGNAQRPQIFCTQQGGLVTLSGPPGHTTYAWSTGETTAEITVQTPGEYQLWVNYGSGMLGSEPVVIDDVNSACMLNSTAESEPAGGTSTIFGWYDLLGRQVTPPSVPTGQLWVVRYADGKMRVKVY